MSSLMGNVICGRLIWLKVLDKTTSRLRKNRAVHFDVRSSIILYVQKHLIVVI